MPAPKRTANIYCNMKTLTDIVIKFWETINAADFDGLQNIMAQDANVILPNTKEIFEGSENYIRFNKDYPGKWYANVDKIFKADNEIVTAVRISDKENLSFYVTSFFKFKDGLISEITEYWGENGEVPQWRKGKDYSKEYK